MKIYKTQKQVEKDIKKGELTMPTGKKIEKNNLRR